MDLDLQGYPPHPKLKSILFDHKKFNDVRTHPKELRAMKSTKHLQFYIISSKIYFSCHVVLREEFLRYWIF